MDVEPEPPDKVTEWRADMLVLAGFTHYQAERLALSPLLSWHDAAELLGRVKDSAVAFDLLSD